MQAQKQYRSLQDIFRGEDFSLLYRNGYSNELINWIVKQIKTHKSIRKIIFSIIKDIQIRNLICNETQFIDGIIKKYKKELTKYNLIYNQLYCILNGITQPPKCQFCGNINEQFLFRWQNNVHSEYCSMKCSLNAMKNKNMQSIVSNDEYVYSPNDIEKFHPQLVQLVHDKPHSYFNLIINSKNKDFARFILAYTSFIDYDCNFATRCRYVLDRRQAMYTCHKCGKPIRKQFKCTEHQEKFWCSTKCLAEDDYINNKIGKKNSNAYKKQSTRNDLPTECHIIYRNSSIIYDDEKNQQIYELFMQHQKTFEYWLKQNKELYDYFMDVTYPINYTNLHFGTRLYWLIHKFQEFPKCKICGRQLDFKNVKLSNDWPIVCSSQCRKEYVGKLTEIRHRNDQYDRILAQTEIQPLFSRNFYLEHGCLYDKYFVKCKKCVYKFYGKINPTFFYRGNCQNLFRCPYCHPSTKYRSKAEKNVFNYVKDDLGYLDAVYSYHNVIWPYEIDIYIPSKKVAIEFNGILWHSLENEIKIEYHINKTLKCEDVGVKLIHIWEEEWYKNKKQIKSLIKNVLNGTQKLIYDIKDGNFIVDRSKFNKVFVEEQGYSIIDEMPIEVIERCIRKNNIFHVPNCGYLICKK